MAVEVVISGMTVANPIAVVPPAITGLVAWTYFGNMFPTDNTNLVAGGSTYANIGSGPQSISSNYAVMWYNAAISSGWRRTNDNSNGPATYVAVGRQHAPGGTGIAALMGDPNIYMAELQTDSTNGNQPTISAYHNPARVAPLTVPSVSAFRAAAISVPATTVAGTVFVYDLTAGVQASVALTGISSPGVTSLAFGTTTSFGSATIATDIAFGAIIAGQQLTLAQLQAQVMPALRSMMTLRGITI